MVPIDTTTVDLGQSHGQSADRVPPTTGKDTHGGNASPLGCSPQQERQVEWDQVGHSTGSADPDRSSRIPHHSPQQAVTDAENTRENTVPQAGTTINAYQLPPTRLTVTTATMTPSVDHVAVSCFMSQSVAVMDAHHTP